MQKAFVRLWMSFYDGVLGVVRLSAKIKPISDSKRMPLLEFVGCEPLLGGSKKFCVIRSIFA